VSDNHIVDCECKYKDLFGLQNNLDKNLSYFSVYFLTVSFPSL
jgi:hypothetical protein